MANGRQEMEIEGKTTVACVGCGRHCTKFPGRMDAIQKQEQVERSLVEKYMNVASSLKDKSHSCNKSSEDSATREGHVLKLAEMAANDEKQEDEERHLINKLFKQLRKEREVEDEARALLEEMQKNLEEAQARASAT